MEKLAETLHALERKVLPLLVDGITLKQVIEKSGLSEVEVMRALQWLENKNIIKVKKDVKEIISLDVNGKKYVNNELPEKTFLRCLDKELSLNELREKSKLSNDEINVSLGLLKKKNAIIVDGKVRVTEKGKNLLRENREEEFLKKLPLSLDNLSKEEKEIYNNLKIRKGIIKTSLVKDRVVYLTDLGKKLQKLKIKDDLVDNITPNLLRNSSWKNKKFRRFDIKINVPKIYYGKRHFVNQAIEYAKKIWLELGFKEMQGNLIQTSFWNFDALFQPQDHPARDLQDTLFIKSPDKGKLPSKEIVNSVKQAHEKGVLGSKGWNYKWDIEEAKKNVLRTHTTVLSARTIAALKKENLPAKYFSIGKCFRNETLDWSHLFEFYQVEGIVVDESVNFRQLLGYLKEFFYKMGFPRVRIRPGYFPYTEPSAEVDVYDVEHDRWIELAGSGIFRPEVVAPLIGKDVPVLAWGLGFPRIIMDYYNIKDVRELYKNDLKQLREMKPWLK